jgi:ferritin-like metal-binding protein YciE
MAKLKTLHDLYVSELKDLYSAENQILRALPKMSKAASSPQLQQAFSDHLKQTQRQVERLDQIFNNLGQKPTGKKCKGMEGLIEEGKEMLEENISPDVLDAALIVAAQKVEHYEMAGYGSARTYANMLGDQKAANLLQQTLDEEGDTDKRLTQIAESMVNPEAINNPSDGMSSTRLGY